MTCDTVREMIQPLVDEELAPEQRMEIDAHLRGCIGCAEFLHELTELRKSIRDTAPYYPAPGHLRGRVQTALRAQDHGEKFAWARWNWLAAAASLGFAAAILWGIVLLRSGTPQTELLAQEMISAHVRSMMAGHLVDVPTSDQHTVKPWFNGKLDFSPEVKDLAAEGFPLRGGRLEYLNQRPVAALVYQRQQHIINLFVWPASGTARDTALTRSGFHVVHWTSGGLDYWAVSDVNERDLQNFARAYAGIR